MNKLVIACAMLGLLFACSRRAAQQVPAPSASMRDVQTRALPTSRRPTVDPKSTQAALDLAHAFTRLLNGRQFNEAYMLLGAKAPARALFDKDFSRFSDLTTTLGAAGLQDGAAGSVYLSIPLTVAGKEDGRKLSRSATLVMRRVNQVQGSTEAERHWHIDRIDWRT